GAEAAAPHPDPAAVEVAAPGDVIDPGGKGALGGGIAVAHEVLAGPRHVHHQGGDARAMKQLAGALAVLLPAVDPAPMHNHRRPRAARRNLQVADEGLSIEGKLDDLERRRKISRGLAKEAQRMPIGFHLAGRARHGIAADVAILERQRVELGKLAARRALARARIGLALVIEPNLAPQRRPVVAIEALELVDDALRVLAADALERVDVAGTAHDLALDLVERA